MADNKTVNEKKPEKKAEKKPNWFVRAWRAIRKWCHELRLELKKVTWPSGKDVLRDTLIVLVCVLVVGVCIWAFDWLSTSVVKALLTIFAA